MKETESKLEMKRGKEEETDESIREEERNEEIKE